MNIEGVPYYRFLVTFRLANGKRRRWVRWSPGEPWVFGEVTRELNERFSASELPAGSDVRVTAI